MSSSKNQLNKRRKRSSSNEHDAYASAVRIKINDARHMPRAPRRRSVRLSERDLHSNDDNKENLDNRSPPGAYPGSEGYSPIARQKSSKTSSSASVTERETKVPKRKAIGVTKPEEPMLPVDEQCSPVPDATRGLPDKKNASTREYASDETDEEDDEDDKGEPAKRQPIRRSIPLSQRRKSFQVNPYGGALPKESVTASTGIPTPSPSPSPKFSFEDEPSSPDSPFAQEAMKDTGATAKHAASMNDIPDLAQVTRKNYPNTRRQSRILNERRAKLPSINEDSEGHGSTDPTSDYRPLTRGRLTSSVIAQHGCAGSRSSSSDDFEKPFSPETSPGSSRKHGSDSSSKSGSSLSEACLELARTFRTVAENQQTQIQQNQQIITQHYTKPPAAPAPVQVSLVDNTERRQIFVEGSGKLVRFSEEHAIFNLEPQPQGLHHEHIASVPKKNYFAPNGGLRKNRRSIPVDAALDLLRAHEIEYRYRVDECPFQRRLGLYRPGSGMQWSSFWEVHWSSDHAEFSFQVVQWPSFYASMKNSVFGTHRVDYPQEYTMPFSPATGELLAWQQCCGETPIPPLALSNKPQNSWHDFNHDLHASDTARRASGPMEGVESTGPLAVDNTWNTSQGIHFGNDSVSGAAPPIHRQTMPCKNRLLGLDCLQGEYCPFSHAPDIILQAQEAPRRKLDQEYQILWYSISVALGWSWAELNEGDRLQKVIMFLRERANTIQIHLDECTQDNVAKSRLNDANTQDLDVTVKQWWANFGKSPVPADLADALGMFKKTMVQASKMITGKWNFNQTNSFQQGNNKNKNNFAGKDNRHGNPRGQNNRNNNNNVSKPNSQNKKKSQNNNSDNINGGNNNKNNKNQNRNHNNNGGNKNNHQNRKKNFSKNNVFQNGHNNNNQRNQNDQNRKGRGRGNNQS
ncbi:hypothetical protein T440DRAFT_555825 [Plenodomus tracheiphilus IPT5]|uniref:C3H1-type domain-containing protein n=1 Tax=Plenodomus tracheiphilus IPT5 TaxID=1408161 RepID=A0A6A7B4B6_9PLEO|nr:hypothetical protein T440DRAFT_555825 [Plenodomus tracheiphilus IPT5]